MNSKYKTYEELKEELGNDYDLFMYEAILFLLKRRDKAREKIYKIIENNNSCLSNPEHTIINNHALLRLNNIECNELLEILGDKE